jgi:hypothetical protein
MKVTTTSPRLGPNQYPGPNPYPVELTLLGSGETLRSVTLQVAKPATGLCSHGEPLFRAAVHVDLAKMEEFVDYYCAHTTTTTVHVRCQAGIGPTMSWG